MIVSSAVSFRARPRGNNVRAGIRRSPGGVHMQGKATLFGHPIHPILVSFPIGFFVGALISDIVSAFVHTPVWPTLSVVLIGFGVIGALLAATFGLIDYITAPMSDAAKKTAT